MSDVVRGGSHTSRRRSAAADSSSSSAACNDQADGRPRRSSLADSVDSVQSSSGEELDGRQFDDSPGDSIAGLPSAAAGAQSLPRVSDSTALKVSSSFSGSHRSTLSTATVRSLGSTLAEGHAHVHPSSLGRYVRLNVGGSLFYTTVDTLCKKDTMLRAMFTGDLAVQVDREGFVLIDRQGKHFATVLNYLRDGDVPLPEVVPECAELMVEAQYYLLDELVLKLDEHTEKIKKDKLTICRLPMVTSSEEFQRIVAGTRKPIIRFIFNRSNNKYSYTGTSDDNLLKNVELFDRLSTRFMDRVVFVKDIVGGSEICTWIFYGHGKRQAEISCNAIVYATDNKHIKIDYPEAKIYEECLNIMLFEDRFLDAEKAAAAQKRAAILSRWKRVGNVVMSDDDN